MTGQDDGAGWQHGGALLMCRRIGQPAAFTQWPSAAEALAAAVDLSPCHPHLCDGDHAVIWMGTRYGSPWLRVRSVIGLPAPERPPPRERRNERERAARRDRRQDTKVTPRQGDSE